MFNTVHISVEYNDNINGFLIHLKGNNMMKNIKEFFSILNFPPNLIINKLTKISIEKL